MKNSGKNLINSNVAITVIKVKCGDLKKKCVTLSLTVSPNKDRFHMRSNCITCSEPVRPTSTIFIPLLLLIGIGCRISELIALSLYELRTKTQQDKRIYSVKKWRKIYKQHVKLTLPAQDVTTFKFKSNTYT